jgi:hypothetical protein
MLCCGEPVTPVSDRHPCLATLRGVRGGRWTPVPMGLGAMAISVACHGTARAQEAAVQAGGGASSSGGTFDLWKELVAWLGKFGPAGFAILAVLALLGWVVSQAGNLEKILGWFRPKPEPPSSSMASSTGPQPPSPSDPSASTTVSGSHNKVVSGKGNQVLSNISTGGDLVLGDKVGGDKVAGDKFTCDKVAGNKIIHQAPAAAAPGPGQAAGGASGGLPRRPGPWRVFLSHTSELRQFPASGSYIDKAERAVSASGHAIVDMADFPSIDEAPAQVCIERVRGCDVFVGIFGMRYGSPVRDRPDVSYTELEFITASEAGMPRLVFLIDGDSEELGLPPKALVDLEYGQRQQSFLQRVKEAGLTVQRFRNPDDLKALVERSLRELAESLPSV